MVRKNTAALLLIWLQALLLLSTAWLGGCSAGTATFEPPSAAGVQPAAATSEAATSEKVAEELSVDPAVIRGRLDNGLTYILRRNGRPENRAELRLVVNAGSILEDEDQLGLAHFVEHMAFNGTESFEHQALVDYLENLGIRFGPDLNAYTGFDETVYMLTVPVDDPEVVATAFEILSEWAAKVSFEGEEIDKERGVVLEEWRLGRGAQARIDEDQLPIVFYGSRYAERLPIGAKEIIEAGTHDALRRFYSQWYRPDLMAVVAVGDFEPATVEALIRKYFAPLEGPGSPRPRQTFEVPPHPETLVSVATDPELSTTSVSIYAKRPRDPEGTRAAYRATLVRSLGQMLLSERLDEVSQRPEPPFLFALASGGSLSRTVDYDGLIAVVAEGEAQRGLEAVLLEARRARLHGFSAGELERVKQDVLSGYEQAFRERDKEDSALFADEYVRHFLEGESIPGIAVELELVREMLPTITLDEVHRAATDWSRPENRILLVSGPAKEGLEMPTEESLLALAQDVSQRQPEPWVDRTVDEPLLAQLPTPGPMVEERRIEEIGVTEWRLANGVRVVLKPTDFRNDQVLVVGTSPGGHSLVPDEDYLSASFAASLMAEGGLGRFDRIALRKAMAGKLVNFSATLGELSEGVAGQASPQDLETLFQLLYLKVTAPRPDEEAFEVYRSKLRTLVENRLASPGAVFIDRVSKVLSRDHPRRQPLTLEDVDKLDLEVAARIYRERFADAGDFTFFILGSFEPQAIRPWVETYLGGLPSTGRQETWRDVGVRRPEGVQKVEVAKGLEPKSQVLLSFGGEAPFSREASHEMDTLAAVLEIRLREVLREDRGGTYGVAVSGDLQDRPRETYDLTISFGCAPDAAQQLIDAVFEEIRNVHAQGIDPANLAKVQESQLRSRETNLEENGFWLTGLRFFYDRGLDPRDLLDYEPMVRAVTPEALQEAARRYLRLDDYVLGVLLPEEQPPSELLDESQSDGGR